MNVQIICNHSSINTDIMAHLFLDWVAQGTLFFVFVFLSFFFLSLYAVWGILVPHRRSNLHPLYWKADSQPLDS